MAVVLAVPKVAGTANYTAPAKLAGAAANVAAAAANLAAAVPNNQEGANRFVAARRTVQPHANPSHRIHPFAPGTGWLHSAAGPSCVVPAPSAGYCVEPVVPVNLYRGVLRFLVLEVVGHPSRTGLSPLHSRRSSPRPSGPPRSTWRSISQHFSDSAPSVSSASFYDVGSEHGAGSQSLLGFLFGLLKLACRHACTGSAHCSGPHSLYPERVDIQHYHCFPPPPWLPCHVDQPTCTGKNNTLVSGLGEVTLTGLTTEHN